MLNLPDSVTVTRRGVRTVDENTGDPVLRDVDVLQNFPCAFAVLSASQHEQSWGADVDTTATTTARGNLILANHAALEPPLSDYTATIDGYPGTWRIISERPGRACTTYLVER